MADTPESPTTGAQAIDKDVSRRYWHERSAQADDPRSVTLDRESAASVARNVRLHQRWATRALEELGVPLRRVLDLGCGNGDWTLMLAQRAERLVAVDFAEGFVAHVRERLRAAGLAERATVVQHDAASYEPEGPYDLIVAGAVTQYLSDEEIARVLPRLRAALAPGGALYLRTTIAQHKERVTKTSDAFQGIYRSRAWYRQALADAGYTLERDAGATSYIADEIAFRTFGKHAASRVLALPIKAFRWAYRFPRALEVYGAIAR